MLHAAPWRAQRGVTGDALGAASFQVLADQSEPGKAGEVPAEVGPPVGQQGSGGTWGYVPSGTMIAGGGSDYGLNRGPGHGPGFGPSFGTGGIGPGDGGEVFFLERRGIHEAANSPNFGARFQGKGPLF